MIYLGLMAMRMDAAATARLNQYFGQIGNVLGAYSGRIRSAIPTASDQPFRTHSISDSDHSINRSDDLISHSDDSITRSDDLITANKGGCSVV